MRYQPLLELIFQIAGRGAEYIKLVKEPLKQFSVMLVLTDIHSERKKSGLHIFDDVGVDRYRRSEKK